MSLQPRHRKSPNVFVAQLGARMHYAVPQILYEVGMLECFATDFYADRRWRFVLEVLQRFSSSASIVSASNRYCAALAEDKIYSRNLFGLRYVRRLSRAGTLDDMRTVWLWAGTELGRLAKRRGFGNATTVYVFNTAGLDILDAASQLGLRKFVEQTVAPEEYRIGLLQAERAMHPNWCLDDFRETSVYRELVQRERAEWALADQIVCGSEFVRDAIHAVDGPVEKCIVVPYGVHEFDGGNDNVPANEMRRGARLRVLTVGTIDVRKGAPYLSRIAQEARSFAEFRAVGPLAVPHRCIAALGENVDLVGRVSRSRVVDHYRWADVFLLPSVCEGSATVTYEAAMAGLPVICTVNSGSLVEHGIDGYVFNVGDVNQCVDHLRHLAYNEDALSTMKHNVWNNRRKYCFDAYRHRLINAIDGHCVPINERAIVTEQCI